MLTKGAIGNLINRYRAVLDKCRLLNVFGSLAVAGMLVMGGAGIAVGAIQWQDSLPSDKNLLNGQGSDGYGGAIRLKDKSDITIDGYTFIKNTSNTGGGAIVFSSSGKTPLYNTIYDSDFTGNTSQYGGAISIYMNDIDVKDSNFTGNEVSNGYGGAIYTQEGVLNITGTTFSGNKASGTVFDGNGKLQNGGGAIYGGVYNGTVPIINITDSSFKNNETEGYGGAIGASGSLTIDHVRFEGNKAKIGGAIGATSSASELNITTSHFEGNIATDRGGALDLSSVVTTTLKGTNTFSQNYVGDTLNDIYNSNRLVVESGTTELLSGYQQNKNNDNAQPALEINTAQLAVDGEGMDLQAGSVTVNQGGALGHGTDIADLQTALAEAETSGVNTKGGAYVAKRPLDLSKAALTVGNATGAAAGQPVFGSGSTLLMDPAELGDSAAFYGVETAMVDGSTVYVQNAETGQTLKVFAKDEAGTAPVNIVGKATVEASSSMIDGTLNSDGTLTTATADVNAALPGVTPSLGALMTGMFDDNLQGVINNEPGAMFLSRLVEDGYLRDNKSAAVRTLESAARMGLAVAPQMTWAANNAGIGAVAQRTTLARPQGSGMRAVDANGTPQTGISSGDGLKSGFGMWVMPLYQHWSANGLSGGGLDLDVKGNLGGVALGADYTINDSIRAGLTFNIGGGEAEGSGDFNDTDNNFSFWGIGAYAGWTYSNFGLTADLNYTQTDNDVEQDMPAAMQMGKLESDIDSRAVSVGLRGEYKIATDALDIIPHAGVRYTWLKTDSYDVSSAAGTVMKGDAVDQDIWTFPVGVAFAKEFVTESGWNVRPSLDLSVIPAAGDLKARGDVRFTGVNGAASVKTEVMDKVTGMGQIGLDFGKDDVSMGLNYSLQAGENTTAHGLFATFRYEF